MVLRPGQEPKSIQYPHRNISYLRDPSLVTRRLPAGSRYRDPRQLRQLKVRFDLDAETNPWAGAPNTQIYSPWDKMVAIDSADDIRQPYYVHANTGREGFTVMRPMIDPVHKIMTTYHFDRVNLRWVRMVTRLRPDLPLPQPPANQLVNASLPYWSSRGTRYVRNRVRTPQAPVRRDIANRRYRDRSGVSGAHGILGEFRAIR